MEQKYGWFTFWKIDMIIFQKQKMKRKRVGIYKKCSFTISGYYSQSGKEEYHHLKKNNKGDPL